MIGIKESANFTTAIVILKVAVVCIFIALASAFLFKHNWQPNHWHPFIPPNTGESGHFGWSGVLRGAGVVFFAYIGFDAVSTAAQEAKNPKRDMPFGILGSLVICTILYILVSGLLTRLVPYTELNVPDPVVVGNPRDRATVGDIPGGTWSHRRPGDRDAGDVAGTIARLLLDVAGWPVMAMGRQDSSAIPDALSQFDRGGTVRCHTGHACTSQYSGRNDQRGDAAGVCAGQCGSLGHAQDTSGVESSVQNPAGSAGADSCHSVFHGAIIGSSPMTQLRLVVWLVIGLGIYFGYGRKHSKVQHAISKGAGAEPARSMAD